MAEYRYYLIPDFMSHVFPQQFEEQAPTEFFSNTADLMKRYKQLREMPYNNEYTWNERTNLPYPRLTVGIDRRDPDGAVTIMHVRNGVNYLCDDYRGPFADRNDKQLIEMAKQLVTAVGVDRIRPHYYTEENGHTKVYVGKDIHITEWANAPELCRALHFSRFLNRDGQQLFQVRNGQRIIENYADGSRLVKDVQTVDDTHFYVGSRFCHIQQYANQCFPLAGRCAIQRDCKVPPLEAYKKSLPPGTVSYLGLAADEPIRLERLKPDQVSLMAKYGVTEQDAFAMCRQEGLLSPLYEYSHRGGCWFCPNASMTELRHLYHAHPDLWQLMLELQDTPNKATERFNRNFTFAELDLRFRLEGEQLSFYDQELEVER